MFLKVMNNINEIIVILLYNTIELFPQLTHMCQVKGKEYHSNGVKGVSKLNAGSEIEDNIFASISRSSI